jgi:hypothetical protein
MMGIDLPTKLAATLLCLGDIPYLHAKQMTAEQINSLYQFDHDPIPRALGGPDEPWNLMPRLIAAHRDKTRNYDIPSLAKTRRIARRWQEHRDRLRNKTGR